MSTMTREAILEAVRRQNIRFIRLQFTDIMGVVKNVAIPVSQIEKAMDNDIMFDGSSIEGFTRIEESDMNLRPDLDTFTIFPWRDPAVGRFICDVYRPNGDPFIGDPRYILRKVLEEASDMGFTVMAGPECEFFLFKKPNGIPVPETHDQAGYFDLGPVDGGEDARRDIVLALEEMGFEVEASHHEVAAGQHEIDFKYGDALHTADRVITFKLVTRAIAARHNLHATFMPKPIAGINGSGMHTHFSLFKDGRNAFYDPNGPYQLSETALYFVGGILKHAPGFTAVTNPLVNSYKRLVPGYEAPVYIAWSATNRSALIRVPASRGQGTRIELRSPDPSCNPYLAFALIIKAGLDGIRNRIEPPPSINKNIFAMTLQEREEHAIRALPGSLQEAIEALKADELMQETLGPHILPKYLQAKQTEWDQFRTAVHPWELDRYLGRY